MALQGDIKDFSVVDILQLLSQQQKSGILSISDKGNDVQVFFDRGKIISSNSTKRNVEEHLGEMLLKANLINRLQLQKVLEIQRETLKQIGDILIENDYITTNDLKYFLKLQTHETIFNLLSWKKGNYNFSQRLISYNTKIVDPINTEHFLMDCLRMVDELPDIRKKIGSNNIVFDKVPGAEENISSWKVHSSDNAIEAETLFTDQSDKPKDEETITAEEKKVFSFVDGKQTVQDIINLSLIGEFETTKALASLLKSGLIEVSHEKQVEKSLITETISPKNILLETTFFAILLGLILFLALLYPRIVSNATLSDSNKALLDYPQTRLELQSIAIDLSTFYLLKSRYPTDLSELYRDGFMKNVREGWEKRFAYSSSGDSYRLQPGQ